MFKKLLVTIFTTIALNCFGGVPLLHDWYSRKGVDVLTPINDISFYIVSNYVNLGTGPAIVAPELTTNVTWVSPLGYSTNVLTPHVSFFTNQGMYTIKCSDWSKIRRLYFSAQFNQPYISYFSNTFEDIGSKLTGLNSLESFLQFQGRLRTNITPIASVFSPNISNAASVFLNCTNLYGAFPSVSRLSNAVTVNGMFQWCNNVTGSMPDISYLINTTNANALFYSCYSMTGSIIGLTNMSKLVISQSMFQDCISLTCNVPDISVMTNLTDIGGMFSGATRLTGTLPDISKLTKLKYIQTAFGGLYGITNSDLPDLTPLTNLYTAQGSFQNLANCRGAFIKGFPTTTNAVDFGYAFRYSPYVTGAIPTMTGMVNLAGGSMYEIFRGCRGLNTYPPAFGGGTNISTLYGTFGGCYAITGTPPSITGLIHLSTMDSTFISNTNTIQMVGSFENVTNLTSLAYTYQSCSVMTSQIPQNITNCYKLTTAFRAFEDCFRISGPFPYLGMWTNITTLSETFYRCYNLTGGVYGIDNLTKLTSLGYTFDTCSNLTYVESFNTISNLSATALLNTFYNCRSLTNIPSFTNSINVTTLAQTFSGCSNIVQPLTDIFGTLTNLTSCDYTFLGCYNMPGYIPPSIATLPKLTRLYNTFQDCYSLTGAIPDFTTTTNIVYLNATFMNCSNLEGDLSVIFSNTNNLRNLKTSQGLFANHVKLKGEGMKFVNAPKDPTYTVGNTVAYSSYRTFYNCTNLSDYATIPAEYK